MKLESLQIFSTAHRNAVPCIVAPRWCVLDSNAALNVAAQRCAGVYCTATQL